MWCSQRQAERAENTEPDKKRQREADKAEAAAAPWRCPWHACDTCNGPAMKGCAKCVSSYCHAHGNADSEALTPFLVRKLPFPSGFSLPFAG